MITRALVLSLVILLMAPATADAAKKVDHGITCTLSASSKFVQPGEKVSVTWNSTKALLAYGPNKTRVSGFGSMTVAPTETTIYKFQFLGVGGNEKCGVRIRVAGDEPKD